MKLTKEQQKEVDQYMEERNVDENEARIALGYIPGDRVQFSYKELYDTVKDAHPDTPLTEKTRDFYVQEMMRIAPIKPNPKLVKLWLDNYLMVTSPPCFGKYAKLSTTIIKYQK